MRRARERPVAVVQQRRSLVFLVFLGDVPRTSTPAVLRTSTRRSLCTGGRSGTVRGRGSGPTPFRTGRSRSEERRAGKECGYGESAQTEYENAQRDNHSTESDISAGREE